MIRSTTLDNGIRVVTQHVRYMHTVSIGIWVANGTRHETPRQNGVAHFIEHLLFKGTGRRSARQIAMEIDSMGGMLNAFTSHEYVCYYAKVLATFLPRITDLLLDIFLHSSFPGDEIERERRVILQEIKMRDDTPDVFIHDQFHRNYWQGHALGRTIPGSLETVGALTRQQIIDYKHESYRPRDIIISAAGNVRHDELLALMGDALSAMASDQCSYGEPPPLPAGPRVNQCVRDMEQTLLCLGTAGLSQNHPDRFALHLLNTILGGGMSSRLFQEVREKRGLAYSIYSYIISHGDCGALVIHAGTEHEQCRELIGIALGQMEQIKREPVPREELDAAREQIKGSLLMSLESSDNLMTRLAKNQIYLRRNQSVEEVLTALDAVDAADILRLGNDIFTGGSLHLEVMGKAGHSGLGTELLHL